MWNLFYCNFRLLILTVLLIIVWGISSFQLIPRMEDPELSQWYSHIITAFPGASAEKVESLVTEKIEQELFEIEDISNIESTSNIGNSFIVVQLKDTVRDFDQVWSKVRDRLSDVSSQLPSGALAPEYNAIDQRAYTLIVALNWNLETNPNYAILRRLAKELKEEFRNIPGTEQVDLFGEPIEEILVEVNSANLSALSLTTQGLSQQISLSDAKVATGKLYHPNNELLIEVETELDSTERIRQLPIRLGNSGEFARLGDIALVKKGIREPPSELAIINGQPGIALAVRIEGKQRIDTWAIVAHRTLEKFRQNNPEEINIELILDQNRYVANRLNSLFANLLLGALLVFGSTLLMMGWKSALVVTSALPLSILMVLAGMRAFSIPLHQMSVTGLVIALGMLIDNGIVVVDEVQYQIEQGIKPKIAIFKSVTYLAIPLLACNLTTILTFLPIALLPGEVGEFVRTIGLSVIIALLSSLFISLTIVPALMGRIYHAWENGDYLGGNQGLSYPFLTRIYSFSLNFILAKPILGVILALILPVTGFLMAFTLQEQFFPPAERDQFQIEFELPSSASLEKTQSVVQNARSIILNHPEVANVYWFLGNEAPEFYYNLPRRGANRSNYAHGMIQLTSDQEVHKLISTLQKELNKAFPSVRVLVKQLEQGPYIAAPIDLRLYGSDLDVLQELGKQIRLILTQV